MPYQVQEWLEEEIKSNTIAITISTIHDINCLCFPYHLLVTFLLFTLLTLNEVLYHAIDKSVIIFTGNRYF